MRTGLAVCLLIVCNASFAQNLVRNPGFEQYYKCPGSYSSNSTGEIAPGWTSPSTGTPDMFHMCSTGEAGVPTNWAGHSKAYVGSGYAGIYVFLIRHNKDYREYLQAELITPLEADAEYHVEFYFKLSSNSKYAIDRIGFLLSDSNYLMKDDGTFPVAATYERINRTINTRSAGLWTRFAFTHLAKGGEKYLTIGNFSNSERTRSLYITNSQATEPMLARAAYFYIDEVKVIKVSGNTPPVLTGYPELKTDETYVLKNIQFKYNDYMLLDESFPELKKLVEVLRYHKTWKVVVSGHTDDIGSDIFNNELSLLRAGSVADYLINSGIDPARIKTLGFGKQTPLIKGTDETSRATNRRVELRFLN
ncbi:MAG TPA: OmpA family protein [Cyclobacteriaceae bacterium]|jgi:OOP family OmpA-OmpF porin|nr:OmpA family protein [Cyclobacteriaceae bacterium]HRF33847.1 OmpA family protein [Cyclobacteriaceae bacterium]